MSHPTAVHADDAIPDGEPPVGAHLVTRRHGYLHHGIYVGDGNVIHYAGWSRHLSGGAVEVVTLDGFRAGFELAVIRHARAVRRNRGRAPRGIAPRRMPLPASHEQLRTLLPVVPVRCRAQRSGHVVPAQSGARRCGRRHAGRVRPGCTVASGGGRARMPARVSGLASAAVPSCCRSLRSPNLPVSAATWRDRSDCEDSTASSHPCPRRRPRRPVRGPRRHRTAGDRMHSREKPGATA